MALANKKISSLGSGLVKDRNYFIHLLEHNTNQMFDVPVKNEVEEKV